VSRERDHQVRTVDLLRELVSTIAARPGRALATGIGVALASAAYVATLGLSATLAQEVSDSFDAARATEVDASYLAAPHLATAGTCPVEDVANVERLAGVEAAGQYDVVKSDAIANAVDRTYRVNGPVVGATRGTLSVLGVRLTSGRLFDEGQVRRHDPVALVPEHMATAVGVAATGQTLDIGGRRVLVIGLFRDVVRRPDVLAAAIVPYTTLSDLSTGIDDSQRSCGLIVATRPGAAAQVADQISVALRPDAPEALSVVAPPDPATFRRKLERPVRILSLSLSAAALVVGAASIMSTMTANVSARVSEIGLRKALGARSGDIAVQIIGEALLVGLAGGVAGAMLGGYALIGISIAHSWRPILSLATVGIACASGALLGAGAGLVPAIRAARLPPSEALRR
jgi:putative ABC transport system permease protein